MCSASERRSVRMPSSFTGRPIAAIGGRGEEEELAAALAPERDDLRQAVGGGVVGFVDEQGLAGEIVGQVFGSKAIQGSMRTRPGVVLRPRLAKVLDNALDRAEISTFAHRADQGFVDRLVRHLYRRDSDAVALGKGDDGVIAFDKALLDLLLRRGNDRMGKRVPRRMPTSATICTVLPEPVGCSTSTSSDERQTLNTSFSW